MPVITRTTLVEGPGGKKTLKKQRLRVSKKAVERAKARRVLKSSAKKQPKAVRAAVVQLLPQSQRQVAKKIAYTREQIYKQREAEKVAPTVVEQAQAKAVRKKHVRDLAALVSVARKKRARAAGLVENLERITLDQAKARNQVVLKQLAAMKKRYEALVKMQKAKKGTADIRKKREAVLRAMKIQRAHLLKRRALLKRNLDFVRGRKLAPALVAVQRRKIVLPRLYTMPAAADVTILIRLLAAGMRRRLGEKDAAFKARLRAYTQRAMLRYIKKSVEERKPNNVALREAAQDTLADDAGALEAEADAGGVAADSVAEAMDAVIDPVAEQLDVAAEDFNPEVPAGDPSPEQEDALLVEAAALEIEGAAAPKEDVDLLEEDLLTASPSQSLFSDDDIIADETDLPLWKRPVVWGVAGGAVLLLLLLRR